MDNVEKLREMVSSQKGQQRCQHLLHYKQEGCANVCLGFVHEVIGQMRYIYGKKMCETMQITEILLTTEESSS